MEERTENSSKGKYFIMLADDDPDDRELFEEAAQLLEPKIRIEMVKDGVELMDYLNTSSNIPDTIFLDLNMPKKNGKECLQEIAANNELKNIPIIIYTTSLNPVDVDDTYKCGARYFFRKPNSFDELMEVLAKAFRLVLEASPSKGRDTYILNES
ncbi:MAG TPA: response regulator [Chryseolinea sp.]|nr:response regulator [Chryseolinea sp.]